MAQRRHHYERAFEAHLRERRIPYVAVNEAKKALLPAGARLRLDAPDSGASLKSFDFVVYGENTNLLVEIKGRKVPRRKSPGTTGARLESWVTLDDLASLRTWERLFGPGYEGAIVFVYQCDDQPPDGLFQETILRDGRWYAVRAIALDDYESAMKTRSPRWRTVDLPARAFERLSRPFTGGADRSWSGGPRPVPDAGRELPALAPIGPATSPASGPAPVYRGPSVP